MKVRDTEANRRSGNASLSVKWKLQGEAANHTPFSLHSRYEKTYVYRIFGVVVRVNAGYGGTGPALDAATGTWTARGRCIRR